MSQAKMSQATLLLLTPDYRLLTPKFKILLCTAVSVLTKNHLRDPATAFGAFLANML